MNAENEASEPYEEPTVPQYQIQLENLDFELKKLKASLFILEQEHSRRQIRIKSKLDSAKRALEKPLQDLEKEKNNDLKDSETVSLNNNDNLLQQNKKRIYRYSINDINLNKDKNGKKTLEKNKILIESRYPKLIYCYKKFFKNIKKLKEIKLSR